MRATALDAQGAVQKSAVTFETSKNTGSSIGPCWTRNLQQSPIMLHPVFNVSNGSTAGKPNLGILGILEMTPIGNSRTPKSRPL